MSNLDKIRNKLAGLNRLKDGATTEAEAVNAAEKIKDILTKYNLHLTEADLEEDPYIEEEFDLGQKTAPTYIHTLAGQIAGLCGTLRYTASRRQGKVVAYFGRKHEVEAASYLHEIVINALKREGATFKETSYYKNLYFGEKRMATISFRLGMAQRIADRIRDMKNIIDPDTEEAGLVTAKDAELRRELATRGVYLVKLPLIKTSILCNAYNKGSDAGDSTTLNKGVNTNERGQGLLN